MRCFVAVDVGEAIRAGVAGIAEAVRAIAEECGLRVSWTRPEGWHVTLAFLGEISEPQARDVAARLREALADMAAFRMSAGGVITLPAGKPPRVLAVNVDGGQTLIELATKVTAALEPAGFAAEARPFRPHLTIGRVREAKGWRRFIEKLAASEPAGERQLQRTVSSVELLESHLGPDGARYTVLESFPLGSSATIGRTATRSSSARAND
jgi:2'-5' RNA ligase